MEDVHFLGFLVSEEADDKVQFYCQCFSHKLSDKISREISLEKILHVQDWVGGEFCPSYKITIDV